MIRSDKQTGYILLPVIVVITLVAAIALLMNTESALESNTAASELDAQQAQYVAEAGLNHALWRTQQQGCGPYSDLTDEPLGSDAYSSKLTSDLGATSAYTISVDQDSWIRADLPTQNFATDLALNIRYMSGVEWRPVLRYNLTSLAAKAPVISATAWFYVSKAHPQGAATIHRITADWTEADATWNTLGDNMDNAVLASIPAQPAAGVWVAVNLTLQVQAWVNGEPNYGIMLNASVDGINGEYASRESANAPYLEVIVGAPPSSPAALKADATLANGVQRSIIRNDVVLRQYPSSFVQWQHDAVQGVDAYIWEFSPTTRYGNDAETWVSYSNNNDSLSLFKFNVDKLLPGTKILDATLSLLHQSGAGSNVPVSAHRIVNPWDEADVTWRERVSGTDWDTFGGDLDDGAVSTTLVGPTSNIRYEWDLTSLAQGWADGAYPNYGVALRTLQNNSFGERFYTSDETIETRRPRLAITYTCSCGSVCVAPQGSGNLLMVVINPTTLVAEDQQAKDLFESWGYTVSLLSESANQSSYDAAVAVNDVVFISETVNSNSVGIRLQNAPIGVVSQDGDYNPDLGLATGSTLKVGADINVTDTDHYITRVFTTGPLQVYAAGMEQLVTSGTLTGDQQVLADIGGDASLVALDKGDAMEGGGNAAGRRVMLPLGTRYRFDWDRLNANGRIMVQRALAWGVGDDKASAGNLLLVVVDPASLSAQEDAKKALIEGWGYSVNLIDESDSQANFDAAIALADVAYVAEDIISGTLGTKLRDANIGVVIEEEKITDEFGISSGETTFTETSIQIVDNTHYITQPFSPGSVTFVASAQPVGGRAGTLAPGLGILAQRPSTSTSMLDVIDVGGALFDTGTAAGRRVKLPWGGDDFDINQLTDDGRTIMRRAIDWGAKVPDPVDTIILSTHDSAVLGGLAFTAADLAEYDPVTDTATLFFDGANLFTDPLENLQAAHVLGNGHVILSTRDNATLGGLSFTQADLVEYDPGSDTATLFFDGASLFGDPLTRISSAQVLGNGHIILSAWAEATLGGLTFNPAQLVKYDPVTDTATLYFDGTTLFGDPTSRVVAVHVLESGHIVLSTWAVNTLGGLSFGEGDLVEYDPVADTATLYFDGVASFTDPLEKLVAAHIKGDDGPSVPAGGGPVAHWKFDETTGTTAVDSVGGNNATLNGNPDWTTGVENGALEFDGSGDYAITDNNFTPPPVGTVMFWMKVPGSPGSHGRIFGLDDSWEVRHVTSGTGDGIPYGLVFDLGVSGVNAEFSTTVTVDTPNRWYFVAATYDTGNDAYQIFLDGALHKSGTYPSSLTMPAAGQLSMGTRTGSSNYFTGTLDDLRIYDRIVNAAEIADFYAASAPPPPGYTELYEPWSATSADTWQTFDLTAFGVPANAVVEVAVINTNNGFERDGGVRAVGSSLERRFALHEAEDGGVDAVTMHVQVDASSQIQHYSDRTADVTFVLLGYWTGATYVERFDAFKAGANASWQPHNLGAYGVGPNQVAELALSQTSTSVEWLVGARSVGSTLQRRIQLHEAENGGIDMVTLMAASDASSIIEVYAEADSVVDFHLLGYWSTPPGTYTENGGVHGQVSTLLTWETNDLTSFGVPADAVAQFVMTNESTDAEVHIGVRETGSTLQRVLDLQEAEDGGSDAASMHVNVDGISQVEWYSEYGGGTRFFYPVGWWVLSP